jgi:hypothetical protein
MAKTIIDPTPPIHLVGKERATRPLGEAHSLGVATWLEASYRPLTDKEDALIINPHASDAALIAWTKAQTECLNEWFVLLTDLDPKGETERTVDSLISLIRCMTEPVETVLSELQRRSLAATIHHHGGVV